jgi:transcriptional regulator with XRE-family HTH domain
MKEPEPVESYPSADDVLAEALQDAAVRLKWDETRLARDVALWLVRHRGEHGLTQSALAQQLGWQQPVVARLERGDHEPSMATLQHLVKTLGGQARISIGPDGVRLVVRRPRALRRLQTPASGEPLEAAAHTLETAARRLSASVSEPVVDAQTSGENSPRRRKPKLSIEKIRTALLERARHDEEPITQKLIAEDLGSTPSTLRRIVSSDGWDAEVRRARGLAAEDNSANA